MTFIIKQTLYYFLYAVEILLIIRVILSWLPIDRDSSLVQFLYTVTEPILSPIRSLLNRSIFGGRGMMIDFSPIIAWLLIDLLQNFIRNL